jgi:hypothetical protein
VSGQPHGLLGARNVSRRAVRAVRAGPSEHQVF